MAVLHRRLKIAVHSLWFDSQLGKQFSSSLKRQDRVLRRLSFLFSQKGWFFSSMGSGGGLKLVAHPI
jgi:hypothetical protein